METDDHNKDTGRDISIWIDEYDDIFSDFDSRPYSDRVLSDDFIGELNKVSKESEIIISELKLLIPDRLRNKETEAVIIKRLHAFFRRGFHQISNLRRQTVVRNVLLLCLGILLMASASYVSRFRTDNPLLNILFVILEPGGWFMVWNSLDQMFNELRRKKGEFIFYSAMVKSKISFVSIK
jgi:hypothetical protein